MLLQCYYVQCYYVQHIKCTYQSPTYTMLRKGYSKIFRYIGKDWVLSQILSFTKRQKLLWVPQFATVHCATYMRIDTITTHSC